MKRHLAIVLVCIVLTTFAAVSRGQEIDDDAFHLLMVQRKLPTPATLTEFSEQVARMQRVGASRSEIAQRMSEVIDARLEASNKPQSGELLFNPLKTGATADRKRRWEALSKVQEMDDGLPGKALEDGRQGARLAEVAWENQVGNCCESANVALEVLLLAGIPARLFNTGVSGGHEFTVIGLKPGANPNDPTTWGDDARVVDGWIGQSLTPQQAFDNPHIFDGKLTTPDGTERVSDQTDGYYNPGAEAKIKALGIKGLLRVVVVDEAKKEVAGAIIKLNMQEPQEATSTDQGIATFTTYPGTVKIEVTPAGDSPLRAGYGEATVESRRSVVTTIVLKNKPTIAITEPSDGATVESSDLTIHGTVSDKDISKVILTIAGKPISVPVENKMFSASVTLDEGVTTILAAAESVQSNSVAVTFGKMSSKWSGKWRGKGRYTMISDSGKEVKQLDVEVEIIQQSDLIIMRLPRQQDSTELKLDPLNPNVAIYKDTKIIVDDPTLKSKVKCDFVLTLKDGKIHCEMKTESNVQSRASDKDPWGKEHVGKSVASLDLDRMQSADRPGS